MPVNLMKQIEKREGKSMKDILMETYPLYENQAGVAKAIGISQPTLSQWLSKLGLKEKTILIVSAPAPAISPDTYPRESEVIFS